MQFFLDFIMPYLDLLGWGLFFGLLAFKQKWAWLLWAGIGLLNFVLADFSLHWSILFQFGLGVYGFYLWHTNAFSSVAKIPEKIDENLLDTMYIVPDAPLQAGEFSQPMQNKDIQLIWIVIGLYISLSFIGVIGFQFNILYLVNLEYLYPLLDILGMCLLVQKRKLGFVFLVLATIFSVSNSVFGSRSVISTDVFIQPAIFTILCIIGYQRWAKG
jgi:hypothetical protein